MDLERHLHKALLSTIVTGATLFSATTASGQEPDRGGFGPGRDEPAIPTTPNTPPNSEPQNPPNTITALVTDPKPVVAATSFFWQHNDACVKIGHFEGPHKANDLSWYRKHYTRLKNIGGVERILGIFYGFPDEGMKDMRTLQNVIPIARDLGMEFGIYYDLMIRMDKAGIICTSNKEGCPRLQIPSGFDLDKYPRIADQLKSDFMRIGDEIILQSLKPNHPFAGTYPFLRDQEGKYILDDNGGLRPEIWIYVSRDLMSQDREPSGDDPGQRFETLHETFQQIDDYYRTLSYKGKKLGRPAWVLDAVFWTAYDGSEGRRVPLDLVQAIPGTVAVTSFGPIADGLGPTHTGEWVEPMGRLYREASEDIATLPLEKQVAVYPGIMTQLVKDFQQCNIEHPILNHPLLSVADWGAMAAMALENAYVPNRAVLQRGAICVYDGEEYEAALLTPEGFDLLLLEELGNKVRE